MSNVTIELTELDELKKAILEEASNGIIKELAVYAKTTLYEAYQNSTYSKNQTKNLADSYVWAVYRDNVLQKKGYLYPTPKATEDIIQTKTKKRLRGRKEADEFLATYKPNLSGFVVVFAARMYYGAYLEKGTRRNKQYVVLSSIMNEINKDPQISFKEIDIQTFQY